VWSTASELRPGCTASKAAKVACFRRESGCLPPGAWRPVMYVGRSQIQREQGGHPAGRAKPHLTSSRHHCRLGEQLHAPRPCGGPPSCQLVHEHGPCAEWTEAHLSPATTTRESDMFVPNRANQGLARGGRKWPLNEAQIPNFRGERVHVISRHPASVTTAPRWVRARGIPSLAKPTGAAWRRCRRPRNSEMKPSYMR
jgi:hypothetical protein